MYAHDTCWYYDTQVDWLVYISRHLLMIFTQTSTAHIHDRQHECSSHTLQTCSISKTSRLCLWRSNKHSSSLSCFLVHVLCFESIQWRIYWETGEGELLPSRLLRVKLIDWFHIDDTIFPSTLITCTLKPAVKDWFKFVFVNRYRQKTFFARFL